MCLYSRLNPKFLSECTTDTQQMKTLCLEALVACSCRADLDLLLG